MWLRGGPGEHGLNSLNFQGAGLMPWTQQRLDPALLGNDQNQQYQAMLAAGLQNLGGGDLLRQQMMSFQQPFNYLQQSGNLNPSLQLQQQQAIQQSMSSNIQQPQAQVLAENLSQHLLQKSHGNQENQTQQQQQQPTYQDTHLIQGDQLLQRQNSSLPSPSYSKPDFVDPSMKFAASVSPGQNMFTSLCPEGSGNLLNLSRSGGHTLLTEQLPQQSWPGPQSILLHRPMPMATQCHLRNIPLRILQWCHHVVTQIPKILFCLGSILIHLAFCSLPLSLAMLLHQHQLMHQQFH